MLPENAAQIQYGVSRGIETSQQFVNDNQDFRIATMLELVDELLGILFFASITLHHLLPESYNLVGRLVFGLLKSFTHIRRRNDNRRTDHTDIFQIVMVLQCGSFAGGNKLGLESRTLPVTPIVFTDVEGSHVNDLVSLVQRFGTCVFAF